MSAAGGASTAAGGASTTAGGASTAAGGASKTAGVDLAAEASRTALAVLEWTGAGATVRELAVGAYHRPAPEQQDTAAVEGWICVPTGTLGGMLV